MPIISSLGALAYPKASFVSFGTGRGYIMAAAGSIQVYNRNASGGTGSGSGSFDLGFSSVGADSSGNMYIQGCQIPTDAILSNGISYPIQIDDTDASPQFDFSLGGAGFGALTTTGNDTFFPKDSYSTGGGASALFNNFVNKTAAGTGITGLDFGTGSSNNGNRLYYNAGKTNLTDMMVLAYTRGLFAGGTDFFVYGYNGAESGRIFSNTFGQLVAVDAKACTNDSGVTIMACENAAGSGGKYYIGRPIQAPGGTGWIFETNSEIYDIDCDDDYVYVSHATNSVSKLNITTGSVVSTYQYASYGQGRYIKVADDGYVYLCNTGVGKLNKNLDIQWGKEVKFEYSPAGGVTVAAGFQGFTVRDNFVYMLGANATYGLFAAKIPSDGTLVSPGQWSFGTGSAINKFSPTAPTRTTGSFVLSAVPSGIVCANLNTLSPTTEPAQTVSSTGIVTNNQAIG